MIQKGSVPNCIICTFAADMNKLVIFDLDGTLLNTIADLAAGVNHTLAAHDLPQHTIDEYTLMVGNGMRKLVMRALPGELAADDDPGVPELISTLSAQGYRLAVASNKIQAGAEKLIQEFFPGIPFVAVMGNSPLYPLKPDAAVVEYIMDKAGTDRAHTVMIGDSGTDIQTARNAGIPVIAVSWGFRPRHELTVADFVADSTDQIQRILERSDSNA